MSNPTCCNCQKEIVGHSMTSGGVHWHPFSCLNATTNPITATIAPPAIDIGAVSIGNVGGGNI